MKIILTILFSFTLFANAQLTVKQVMQCEYRTYYLYSDGNMWAYSNNGGTFIKKWTMPGGVTSWRFLTGAFNYCIALDQSGNYWHTKTFNQDNTDSWFQTTTDTVGTLTGILSVDNYSSAQTLIKSDSSIWYGGVDVYSRFYAGGSLVTSSGTTMLYTQLSPVGVKFRKVVMGGTVILGLTSHGDSLYKWTTGTGAPTTYALIRPAIDVFAGAADFWGVIIPDPTGSQTMGYPFVAGTSTSLYGGGSAFTTPTSIKTFWSLTQPIKVFDVDWQAIHYIDSSGRLFGCGWNSFGEVGNGQEFIGRYTYGGYPNYGWSLANGENPTGLPTQIDTATSWVAIYSNPWFGTTKYFRKNTDSTYSVGRNKANVMGNGFAGNIWTPDNSNLDQFHYNTMDVITPTRVTPISQRTQSYNATPPTVDAANQNITTSSTTITTTGNMLKVFAVSQPAANGVDTICCSIASHAWTQKSGPNTATLTNTTLQTVNVSNMINGTYVFQDLVSDNHSGQDTVQVAINVSISTNQPWIHHTRKFKSKQL